MTPEQAVAEFCGKYGLPTYEISDRFEIAFGYEGRGNKWLNSDYKGCYFIFARSGQLLYVGKASNRNSIGDRLDDYFEGIRSQNPGAPKGTWTEPPAYVRTIRVDNGLAASLEEYLIEVLDPVDNKIGRRPGSWFKAA